MIHRYHMNGKYLVLDVNSGAVHVVDELVYQLVDIYPVRSLEEAKRSYPFEKHKEVQEAWMEIQALEEAGLIFSKADYEHLLPQHHKRRTLKAMCLHVAHDCNLKCRYCFASQGDFGGEKALMPEEVGKRALDFLVSQSQGRVHLEVDFFGGEPLMNFDVIKSLVAYGQDLGEKYGKSFRFTITTNGVLLDDEKIEYINKHMYNVVLSLDGRREIHDAMRPTTNDKGSYDLIVPKFQKLIKKRGNKPYYVRGTFTRQNLDFGKDILHFKDLGFEQTSIEPVVDSQENPYALREQDLPRILREYETFAKIYGDLQTSGDRFRFFHFMVDLTQGPCIIKRMTGCGAGVEYLAVTPEGDLYPCHQFVGQQTFRMGNVLDECVTLPQDLQRRFQEANVFTKEDCQQCWAKFYCSGGCHANAWNFNHSIQKPYEMGCVMQKKRLECAIMVEAMMAEKDGEE